MFFTMVPRLRALESILIKLRLFLKKLSEEAADFEV